MRKTTKTFVIIAFILLVLIVLKLVLVFFDLHTFLGLRFRFVSSLPFMLLCFMIDGLVLGILTIQKRWPRILFIILCVILCVVFVLMLGLGALLGNYRNSKEFVRVDIPNSNKIAVLNPDGVVPAWVGKQEGLACYVQVNPFLLREVKPFIYGSDTALANGDWRTWDKLNKIYRERKYYWEGDALVFVLNDGTFYERYWYDYSAYTD